MNLPDYSTSLGCHRKWDSLRPDVAESDKHQFLFSFTEVSVKITIELDFDSPPTQQEVYDYLKELMADDNLAYSQTQDPSWSQGELNPRKEG